MSVEDYEILKVLSKHNLSKTLKTKYKCNNEIFVWNALNYENLDEATRKSVLEKIEWRVALQHPNILEFQNPIKQEDSKTYYLVTKYCKNGSLRDMIYFCLKNNKLLTEEFLCRILYQIAFAIKTVDSYTGKLQLKEIFFDENFMVKLYNFELEDSTLGTEQNMSELGVLLFKICTLEEDVIDYEKKLMKLNKFYSKKLLLLIIDMMSDNGNLKDNIDKILCHPQVLLTSAGWNRTRCFMQIDESICISDTNQEDESSYLIKLKKLNSKEIALQRREDKLNEWNYRLASREKEIALMERTAREKLQQAELYLKRCRENKSTSSSETSKYKTGSTNIKYDSNLDSTYISVGDSIIQPTSKKLNVNEIVKPAPFTKSLSERRIRFKGHSPLKDIDFNKKKCAKQTKKTKEIKTDWSTCSEDNIRSSINDRRKTINNKCKQLFPKSSPTYENDDLKIHREPCEPIKWTEESKKNAFRLLRMMNNDKENKCDMKHTYL